MKQNLFSRDFTLVVIGQIISLFGNATIRFALPLYLLNQTGSSALYGTVMACAFIPTILLSPIGGIVADRVNKRNIMVILDFFTAAVILIFSLLMGSVNLVVLLTVTMMLLYGIAGAYQPAVQASIPALTDPEHFMEANSVINTISSFANLIGPVLGGMLYSAYGLKMVLILCMVCFFLSAVMEIFIRIPFVRQASEGSILKMVKGDFYESFRFIQKEKPQIGRVTLVVCGINLFLSAMIMVAVPYLVTEVLKFGSENTANTLYSFSQGALAAGGLTGGILAGVLGKRLSVQKAGSLIAAAAAAVFPMGIALALDLPAMESYLVITGCCFAIMVLSTMFSVQMISFVQAETPGHLIGKVIAVILTIAMCAQPLGNALYGVLFELCKGFEFAVVLFAGGISLVIALAAGRRFRELA
ncbi:MAG: MFS transporter [Lachnospiraceae bacterium]|uniref:MFS transporter n=1 Tax=Candidatus Merdisoma sp. JLR.KK011 TaxID=3114299 RepID=UPI001434ECE9|nr:MFS transporter [Lachnospiraceae bacterium]MCI9480363.1 MFS transporter [Lachnospiraceae bacterium]MCI9623329.1 MFS transporter [Lachnospiraceae bacterium]GFI09038.1 lysophospholipid transporter LplT [Lachnospiraceae bacterium]